jgi:hypothetical protein
MPLQLDSVARVVESKAGTTCSVARAANNGTLHIATAEDELERYQE